MSDNLQELVLVGLYKAAVPIHSSLYARMCTTLDVCEHWQLALSDSDQLISSRSYCGAVYSTGVCLFTSIAARHHDLHATSLSPSLVPLHSSPVMHSLSTRSVLFSALRQMSGPCCCCCCCYLNVQFADNTALSCSAADAVSMVTALCSSLTSDRIVLDVLLRRLV